MPPRTANDPCSVTGSSRAKPASDQQIGQIVRRDLGARPDLDRRPAAGVRAGRPAAAAPPPTPRPGGPVRWPPGRARGRAPPPPGSAGSCRDRGPPAATGTAATSRSAVGVGGALERGDEEARVAGHLLHVAVGRHDEQRQAPARRAPRPPRRAPWRPGSARRSIRRGRSKASREAVRAKSARSAREGVDTDTVRPSAAFVATEYLARRGRARCRLGRREAASSGSSMRTTRPPRASTTSRPTMLSLAPVGALHEHVRLEPGDERVRRVLVEDHGAVHAGERRQHFRTLVLAG